MKFCAVLLIAVILVGCSKNKAASEKNPEAAFMPKESSSKKNAKTKAKPAPSPVPAPQPVVTNIPSDQPVITSTDDHIGRVAMVNASARFAVLTFPFDKVPQPGQQLILYRKGIKVGQVRITGPQREFNTVADVVAGNAAADDEVRPE